MKQNIYSLFRKINLPRRSRFHKAILLLCAAATFTASVSAQEPAPEPAFADPTRAGSEMSEVMRALRQAEETQQTTQTEISVVRPPLSVVGWVANRDLSGLDPEGVAILRIGESFHLALSGQSIVAEGWDLTMTTISGVAIVAKDNRTDGEIVLRAEAGEQTARRSGDLDVVEFREVPLSLAARALSDETGIRIAVSAEARDLPVSLYLREISGAEALDSLTLTHGLYMSDVPGADIVRLHTGEEYARDANSFLEERTQVFTLKYPNARDVALSIRDLFGDRVRLSNQLDQNNQPGEFLTQDLQQRLDRFDAIDARGQGFGVDSDGGAGGGFQNNNNNRGQSSRNLNNQQNFGRQNFGQQGRNGEIEVDRVAFGDDLSSAEIVALESGDEAMIQQIIEERADIYVTVIDRLNKVMVRTRDEETMQEICELINSIDVATPIVLLEVKIMEVELDRGVESAFDWSFDAGNVAGSFLPSGPASNGDLVFSIMNSSFQAQIRALQQGNKVTMLGKPMLLTANNEVSRLFIGEEVPLNRNFQGGQTVVTDGGPIITPSNTEIEFRPVGSTLLITPNINDDRTVSLRVLQEESRIVEQGAQILVPDQGGGFVNQLIDIVASQTASGTFVAKDRETIAIGGMITEKLQSRRSQVPVLGDIPVVGFLARNQRLERQRKEIVLLLTPHIIKTPGEGEAITRQIVEKNSFHPNSPTGEGQLGSFVPPDVLTVESKEFGPLDKMQEKQLLRAQPIHYGEKAPTLPEKKGFFRRWRK